MTLLMANMVQGAYNAGLEPREPRMTALRAEQMAHVQAARKSRRYPSILTRIGNLVRKFTGSEAQSGSDALAQVEAGPNPSVTATSQNSKATEGHRGGRVTCGKSSRLPSGVEASPSGATASTFEQIAQGLETASNKPPAYSMLSERYWSSSPSMLANTGLGAPASPQLSEPRAEASSSNIISGVSEQQASHSECAHTQFLPATEAVNRSSSTHGGAAATCTPQQTTQMSEGACGKGKQPALKLGVTNELGEIQPSTPWHNWSSNGDRDEDYNTLALQSHTPGVWIADTLRNVHQPTDIAISIAFDKSIESLAGAANNWLDKHNIFETPVLTDNLASEAESSWDAVANPWSGESMLREASPMDRRSAIYDWELAWTLQNYPSSQAEESLNEAALSKLMRQCIVCGDEKNILEYPDRTPTAQCQHSVSTCTQCLESWIASKLESDGYQWIRCSECPLKLEYDDVRRGASKSVFILYDKLATRAALVNLKEFAWCLNAKCGDGQLNPENNNFMKCASCGWEQCVKHACKWHENETCEEYDRRKKASAKAEKTTDAMLDTISKPCPNSKCGWRIQKSHGCDHIRCRQCGHEFCWQCLASHAEIRRVGNTAHAKTCSFHSHNLDISWPFNVH